MEMKGMQWPEARVERLRELVAEGLSASHIANRLGGISRNAVLGKKHRLGLCAPLPEYVINGRVAAKARRATKPKKNGGAVLHAVKAAKKRQPTRQPHLMSDIFGEIVPPTTHADDLLIPVEQRKTLLELTHWTCRFPVGDPAIPGDLFFCGAIPHQGLPYCLAHARRAYQPPRPR